MKKQLLLIVSLLLIVTITSNAQTTLWGMTRTGGANNKGIIFKMNPDGSGYKAVASLNYSSGYNPEGGTLVKAANNKLYGLAKDGGSNNLGTIFSINPVNNAFAVVYNFASASGAHPIGDLCLATDGNFYGLTNGGGLNSRGTLFRFNPTTNVFTVLLNFKRDDDNKALDTGWGVIATLIQGSDGKLYGTTTLGGDNFYGVVFSYNLNTFTYTKIYHFDQFVHAAQGRLLMASNGLLYGMDVEAGGRLYSVNPTTGAFTSIHAFNTTVDLIDKYTTLNSHVSQDVLDRIYGFAPGKSSLNPGRIFRLIPATNTYSEILTFDEAYKGSHPVGGPTRFGTQSFYGVCEDGGANGFGTIWAYNGQFNTFTKLHDFAGGLGGDDPIGNLTIVPCTSAPSTPGAITVSGGSAAVCPGDVRTYTIAAVAGATGYSWTPPNGSSIMGGQGTTAVTISYENFTVNGTLSVKASSTCGLSAARTLNVSRNNPATPGVITVTGGSAAVCPGDARIYTVTNVAGMTYAWTAPTGSTITSGQGTNSIHLSFGDNFAASGSLSVKANNSCGTSAVRTLTITRNTPAQPGVITVSGGTAAVCPGDVRTYKVTNVAGMTYSWVPPAGSSVTSGQGTYIIQLTFNAGFTTAGNLSVTSSNNCGTSPARTLSISRNNPPIPGAITGLASVCAGTAGNYSVAAITGVTLYTWAVPSGATVQSGQGTRTVNVLFGASGGVVSVYATNACGNSGLSTKAISITCREGIQQEIPGNYLTRMALFSNPAHDNVSLSFNSTTSNNYSLRVIDITGRVMKSEEGRAEPGINRHELALSGLAKGIYMVALQTGDQSEQLKMIIE